MTDSRDSCPDCGSADHHECVKPVAKPMHGPYFRTFAELSHHLVGYHPPRDPKTVAALGLVRHAFDDVIDRLAPYIPEGPDATLAARAIHDACQRCIAAIILNQPLPPVDGGGPCPCPIAHCMGENDPHPDCPQYRDRPESNG